jgi:hypothetical protein
MVPSAQSGESVEDAVRWWHAGKVSILQCLNDVKHLSRVTVHLAELALWIWRMQ